MLTTFLFKHFWSKTFLFFSHIGPRLRARHWQSGRRRRTVESPSGVMVLSPGMMVLSGMHLSSPFNHRMHVVVLGPTALILSTLNAYEKL